MRLLLDTHAFLWFIQGDDRLSDVSRGLIENLGNEVLVSAASIWEMAIKHSIGKLELAVPIHEFMSRELAAFQVLEITAAHAIRTGSLPLHHRDPFDRILVAVCLEENLPLLSIDAVFDAYGVDRRWNGTIG